MITKEQFQNMKPGTVIYNYRDSYTVLRPLENGYLVKDNKHKGIKLIFQEEDCEAYSIAPEQIRLGDFL